MSRIRATTGVSTPVPPKSLKPPASPAASPPRPSPRESAHRSPHLESTDDEITEAELEQLRKENLRLKTALLRIEKRIDFEQQEHEKLVASLDKSQTTLQHLRTSTTTKP
jgi:small-conductance mechanosensitive channel